MQTGTQNTTTSLLRCYKRKIPPRLSENTAYSGIN